MIVYCKVLFQHSPEDTEEDDNKPELSAFWPRIELGTFLV
jgi:hypothetical protein